MIRLSDGRLDVDLPSGATAYLDHDWLAEGEVPALVVVGDGELRFGDGPPVRMPDGMDAAAAAAAALGAVAREAASVAAEAGPAATEVLGAGALAQAVRRLLGVGPELTDRPAAIVDLTGDPERIVDATERLADLGLLVLTGPASGRKHPINLYSDVHRRGLRLIGVAPPLADGAALGERIDLGTPILVRSGEPPPDGRWYRLDD